MKKFIIGFVFGAAVASSTVVMASDALQAYLFPSRVAILNSGTIQPIDIDGENAVINYNNKAYIPLRTFAEAIGANVSFEPASEANGNVNQIGLKLDNTPDDIKLPIGDLDGYFNMGELIVSRMPNGRMRISSGTIRINKDLTNKQIEITVYDANGSLFGKSEFVYIIDSETKPPMPGETRAFATRLDYDGKRNIFSYAIQVRDKLQPLRWEQRNNFLHGGIVAVLYPPSGFNGQLPADQISPFTVSFQNNTGYDLVVEPYNWKFKVERLDDADQPVSSVYETTLPTIEGPLQDGSYYSFVVPWNPVDGEGQPVGPGRYRVTLERPNTVSYTASGGETETKPLLRNTRTPSGFTFEID